MANQRSYRFALTWLVMASFCGIIGFAIVYHYATFERPLLNFAVVIDAGSTQTRSSLFSISMDAPAIADWSEKNTEESPSATQVPLNKFLNIRQVSSCVNGGPVSALQSNAGAQKLLDRCIGKFAQRIKELDFLATNNELEPEEETKEANDNFDETLALIDHRVNSVTRLYLGATAGMRALSLLDESKASEKMHWLEVSLNKTKIESMPYVNKGYAGIISGSEEASFGWISVNFICDKLLAEADGLMERPNFWGGKVDNNHQYNLQKDDGKTNSAALTPIIDINSVGTLELGGASAQMAYQVPLSTSPVEILNRSLESQVINLFGGKYHLATRSDLCLGMSQAVLRNNYVLLRNLFPKVNSNLNSIELQNPCLQRNSKVTLSGGQMGTVLKGACLASSSGDSKSDELRTFLSTRDQITFVGTGDTIECTKLLSNLIEPNLCSSYFSICPINKNQQPPPANMSFVTISGYNKALQHLNLTPQDTQQVQVIGERLGGHSIDYLEFISKSRDFCAINAKELPVRYPEIRSPFVNITCMQIVYINKLLTDFYKFDPLTSWSQMKFLLFPTSEQEGNSKSTGKGKHDDKKDIGWALGLVLNGTSQQLNGEDSSNEFSVFYHHGSSVMFILRTTIFVMFACVLLAIAIVVFGLVATKGGGRSGSAYISPPRNYGGADIRNLEGQQ